MKALLFLSSMLAATTPLAGQNAPSVSSEIDRAVAAWAKVKTVRGTFDQTVTNPLTGTSASSSGTFAQERPSKLAIRFNPPMTDAIVSDGSSLWIYLPSSAPGQVIKRRATDRASVPIDLTGQFLDTPRSKYQSMTPADDKTVAGHPAHGVSLTPKSDAGLPFTKATVWIDDDDYLIREFEEVETTGVTRHVRLTALDINGALDASAFSFTPPKGTKVIGEAKTP